MKIVFKTKIYNSIGRIISKAGALQRGFTVHDHWKEISNLLSGARGCGRDIGREISFLMYGNRNWETQCGRKGLFIERSAHGNRK